MNPSHLTVDSAMMPHAYEVLWVLALETKDKPDASARDVYDHAYEHRPDYQSWSPRKVASVLGSLVRYPIGSANWYANLEAYVERKVREVHSGGSA